MFMNFLAVFSLRAPLMLLLAQEDDSPGILVWVLIIIVLILLFIGIIAFFRSSRPDSSAAGDSAASMPESRPAPAAAPMAAAPEPAPTPAPEPEPAPAPAPEPVPVTAPEPDDLKKIEGIGPKIQSVLAAANITTFAQLAATDVDILVKIVREDAGIRVAFPDTWPEQAQLAAAGNWDGLARFQDELKGGRYA